MDTPTPAYQPTPSTSAEDIQWQQVSKELERIAGYDDNQIYADNDDIYVVGTQSKYRDQNIAIEKAALILKNTGSQAARYHLIEQQASIPVLQTNIDVQAYTAVAEQQYVDASITDAIQRENPQPVQAPLQADNHQALHYGLTPVLQQSIGGSEDFYLFNVGINGGASYWLTDISPLVAGSTSTSMITMTNSFMTFHPMALI
ncbi:hypothetical protein VST7929_02210 [Vibrio stylophorae]|uniref:Uncharacterized protein n=1 Tax=Vibrio stylophorae TaxID=659351 RepID=A0ABM8ZVD6_9VIBR|nr:hypothetical protein VST7929_02210 [Vibrio stylophorae]